MCRALRPPTTPKHSSQIRQNVCSPVRLFGWESVLLVPLYLCIHGCPFLLLLLFCFGFVYSPVLHLRFPLSKLQAHLDRFYCPPSSPSQHSFPTTVPTMVSSLPVLTKRFGASARSLPAPEEFPWPPLVGEEKSVGKRVASMMKNASLLSTEFDVRAACRVMGPVGSTSIRLVRSLPLMNMSSCSGSGVSYPPVHMGQFLPGLPGERNGFKIGHDR